MGTITLYQARQQRRLAVQTLNYRKLCGEPVGRASLLPKLDDAFVANIFADASHYAQAGQRLC